MAHSPPAFPVLRAFAAGILLSCLELYLAVRADAELAEHFVELFPAVAVSVLVYTMACAMAGLLLQPLMRRICHADKRVAGQAAIAVPLVILAAAVIGDLIRGDSMQTPASAGVLLSAGLGIGAAVLFVAARGRMGARFAAGFDRALFSAALASATFLPWLAIRLEAVANSGFSGFDAWAPGLLALVSFGVLLALPMSARLLWRAAAAAGCAIVFAGGVRFIGYDPFQHYSPPVEESTGHKIPEVILISIDTLRSDALSCYADDAPETPNFDKLAADSMLFEHAYAAGPWTVPSLVSIHTGVPVEVHHISEFNLTVSEEFQTIAERLTESGYHSGAVVSNPNLVPEHNLVQGFHDYALFKESFKEYRHEPLGRVLMRKAVPERFSTSTTRLTDLAIDWLRKNRSRDSFLWVHYLDPHFPYSPPPEFWVSRDIQNRVYDPYNWEKYDLNDEERELLKQLYLDEVRYVDHEIGRLMSALQTLGLYEDSLIILTSDHGEEFWEHDDFFHGHTLHNELLHVPLMVKMPNGARTGRVAERVANRTVMGTILEMTGLPPRDSRFEFPSLLPLLEGRHSEWTAPPILAGGAVYGDHEDAIIAEHHKIIKESTEGRTALYNLRYDSAETNDLSDHEHHEEIHDLLHEALEAEKTRLAQIRDAAGIGKGESRQVSPGALERLKSLGYVQ